MITPRDHSLDFLLELGKKIHSYTPSIYTNLNVKRGTKSKSRPTPVGSAVLLKFSDRYFLISAAHIFKQFEFKTLGLWHLNTMHYFDGLPHYLSNPSLLNDDKIDIGIVEMSKDFVDTLPPEFQFYDLRHFNIDHLDVDEPRYLIVGSPLTRYKLKVNRKRIENYPLILHTGPVFSESYLQRLGVNHTCNRLFSYERTSFANESGNIQTGPKLEGMSGCGVWMIPEFISLKALTDVAFYPTAILIEYEPKDNLIISTRIRIVTEMLRHLGVDLRRSNLVGLDFNNATFKY